MEGILTLVLLCAVGTTGQVTTPAGLRQDEIDFFSGFLTDGVHVDGTIHMESTSDFHYQITLYFRRPTEKRGSGSVFKVYTKLTADGCDMRNLQAETGASLEVPNPAYGNALCKSAFIASQPNLKDFCAQSQKQTMDMPVFKNVQNITPTMNGDDTFEWTDSLRNANSNALSQAGIRNRNDRNDWVDSTGTDVSFRFYDAVPMFSGLKFNLELTGYALDLDRASVCNKTSSLYNVQTCVVIEEVLKAVNGNADKPLFNETINVGKTVYSFVGSEQNYVLPDGKFIVGQVGAVCQVTDDPFVLTLNDPRSQPGQPGQPGQSVAFDSDEYLKKINAQLQTDLNNCLPAGYTANGAISNLRVTKTYSDGRPAKIEGEMGGAAKKNPAALLRCLKTVEVEGRPLLGTSVSDFKFTPKKGECNEENDPTPQHQRLRPAHHCHVPDP